MTLAEKKNLTIQDQGEVHLLKGDFYFVVIPVTTELKKKNQYTATLFLIAIDKEWLKPQV